MKIKTYYEKLNSKSQIIFIDMLAQPALLSKVHSAAGEVFQLSQCLDDKEEKRMLQVVCSQLETSCLTLSLGLYRPALTTLRLALELGVATIYFSANKLLHREWLSGIEDLKWSRVNSPEDGVLSTRFAKAFFPELVDHCPEYLAKSKSTYRCLSEYVHGNNETWNKSGIVLTKNESLTSIYFQSFDNVVEILKFAFCCRYLKSFDANQRDDNQAMLIEAFTHVAPIREFLGGPKDVK